MRTMRTHRTIWMLPRMLPLDDAERQVLHDLVPRLAEADASEAIPRRARDQLLRLRLRG
jgi:hypothetical protein